MRKISLGNSISSAAIALGCMRIAELDLKSAERIVLTAIEEGVDLFDHADIYARGKSERIFGEVLRRNPGIRDRIIIQSKCSISNGYYDSSSEHILGSVDQSLQRLGIDSLDFLLLHRPDALIEPEDVAEAFNTLEQAGKVRYFGVSNYNPSQIGLLQKYVGQKLVINQLQFSLAHTLSIDSGINVNVHCDHAIDRTGGVLEYCRFNEITVQAWSPFQYGMFEGVFLISDKYKALNEEIKKLALEKGVTDSAIAVAWILRHPAKIQTIVGTMNEQRLRDICVASEVELSRTEWYKLYLAAGNPLP